MATDNTGRNIYVGTPAPGLNNVGSYQTSGVPYLTASTLRASQNNGSVERFEFPRVAKSVTVQVIPGHLVGEQTKTSSPITVFFGDAVDDAKVSRVGTDTYQTNGTDAPSQFTQRHGYTLSLISGSSNSILEGEKITFNIKTDHVNISVNAIGSDATASYQVYAELTNIPAASLPSRLLSGSGINTP